MSKVAPSPSRITEEDDEPVPDKRMRSNAVIPLSASEFREILESDSFIDKTMLIEEILAIEDKNSYLVTAPRRFGKSINLDMLKLFLSIEVDDVGNRKTKSKLNEPIRDTETYRLFMRDIPKLPGRKLKISKEVEIMNQHLGKYPVIYVNFKSASVDSLERAVSECKRVIRKSFCEHEYLCESSKLDDGDKADCKIWCSDSNYRPQYCDQSRISEGLGLELLSKCLFKHFDAKGFVLVDEYDSMAGEAMMQAGNQNELEHIIQFFISCLDFGSKDNKYIRSAFITGISYICTTGLSRLGNVIPCKFLQNKEFFKFYGLTVEELEDLQRRFQVQDSEFQGIVKYYNGYQCSGQQILSIWSVIWYLKFRKLENYWRNSGVVIKLDKILDVNVVKFSLLDICGDMIKTLKVTNVGKIQMSDLYKLKQMLLEPDINLQNPDLFFCFLLEQGYFSISKMYTNTHNEKIMYLSIPNEEIISEFYCKLREYYGTNFKIDFALVERCAFYWNKIDFSDEIDIQGNLKLICELLNSIFKKVELGTKNEASFHHVMFVILLATKFKCSSEALCLKYINNGKLDILLIFEDCLIIIELKYNKTCQDGMKDIIERAYCDTFEKNENLSIKNYILIGANMSFEQIISMCALINNKVIDDKLILV